MKLLVVDAYAREGRAALRAYQKTKRFDDLTPDILAALDEAGRMWEVVSDRLL